MKSLRLFYDCCLIFWLNIFYAFFVFFIISYTSFQIIHFVIQQDVVWLFVISIIYDFNDFFSWPSNSMTFMTYLWLQFYGILINDLPILWHTYLTTFQFYDTSYFMTFQCYELLWHFMTSQFYDLFYDLPNVWLFFFFSFFVTNLMIVQFYDFLYNFFYDVLTSQALCNL